MTNEKKAHEKAEGATSDMFKGFANFKNMGIDRDVLLSNHRKNIEAINDANKMAIEVMKSIATLQSQYIHQTFEDFSGIMREMMQGPMSKEKMQQQAHRMKDNMTKAFEHSANVADIMIKSNHDMYNRVQDRVNESLEDFKIAAKPKYKN